MIRLPVYRLVRQVGGTLAGMVYIETPPRLWPRRRALWEQDPDRFPMPLPPGHIIFRRPADYYCESLGATEHLFVDLENLED